VRSHLEALAMEGIQVFCVTGLGKGRDGVTMLQSREGVPVRAEFVAFSDRVAELLSAADLVVSRAGAGTLAELIRCETPAVLVPFPEAADDHQRANAAYFASQGGGIIVEQSRACDLNREVLKAILDDAVLREWRLNLHRMGRSDPLEMMLDDLEQLTRGSISLSRNACPAVA
jgi:UDP-N-acetylglucosamine--N-acetylmuramyl-(pentapeptide) pyrophosphoryl-undecaprenol N-acetylglucosamine transferase